jgi:hypothetical protein
MSSKAQANLSTLFNPSSTGAGAGHLALDLTLPITTSKKS